MNSSRYSLWSRCNPLQDKVIPVLQFLRDPDVLEHVQKQLVEEGQHEVATDDDESRLASEARF